MPLLKRRAAPAAAPAAESVPGYRDLEQIGRGGFSTVYRARQVALDRIVALKVLTVDLDDAAVERRFLREVRITSRLTGHPHVVTVLDAGTTAGRRPYIAMEYFERGSLQQRLAADGPLAAQDVADIGVKIGGALAAAHAAGILHLDVKPQNVLVSRFGEPALADFGIARLLSAAEPHTGSGALTPYHVAPEVLEGAEATAATDVYGLGSTLYQLLAGRPAFQRDGQDVANLLLRIISEPWPRPARPDVPAALLAAVERAMARRPQDRFQDCGELVRALRDAGGIRPGPEASAAAGPDAWDVQRPAPPAPSQSERRTTRELESASAATVSPSTSAAPPSTEPSALVVATASAPAPAPESPFELEATMHRPDRVLAAEPVAVQRNHRRRWYATAAVFLVLVAVGAARLLLASPTHTATTAGHGGITPSGAFASDAVSAYPSAQIVAARPTNVSAQDLGGSVTLVWKLGSAADEPVLVLVEPTTGQRSTRSVGTGTTTATVGGMSATDGYCFQVGVVLAFGSPDDVIAWSAAVCIRGAVAEATP